MGCENYLLAITALSAVGGMVLGAGLPCIVVPEGHVGESLPDGMAIAWNGSLEAIRATHAALPLLRRARRVTILDGGQPLSASLEDWKPPFGLAGYLARRGIHARIRAGRSEMTSRHSPTVSVISVPSGRSRGRHTR